MTTYESNLDRAIDASQRRSQAAAPLPDPHWGSAAERYQAYCSSKLRALRELEQVPRLQLDQTKVKLVDRLHREMAMTKEHEERFAIMLTFLDALDTLKMIELDVEPPELERVVYVEREVVKKVPAAGNWLEAIDE